MVPAPGAPADTVVAGRAEDVDLWLWKRREDPVVTVTGDRGVLAEFWTVVSSPLG